MKAYVSSFPSKAMYMYILEVCLQIIVLLVVGTYNVKVSVAVTFKWRGNKGCLSLIRYSVVELKLF